jgi:hypothetical protein
MSRAKRLDGICELIEGGLISPEDALKLLENSSYDLWQPNDTAGPITMEGMINAAKAIEEAGPTFNEQIESVIEEQHRALCQQEEERLRAEIDTACAAYGLPYGKETRLKVAGWMNDLYRRRGVVPSAADAIVAMTKVRGPNGTLVDMPNPYGGGLQQPTPSPSPFKIDEADYERWVCQYDGAWVCECGAESIGCNSHSAWCKKAS